MLGGEGLEKRERVGESKRERRMAGERASSYLRIARSLCRDPKEKQEFLARLSGRGSHLPGLAARISRLSRDDALMRGEVLPCISLLKLITLDFGSGMGVGVGGELGGV